MSIRGNEIQESQLRELYAYWDEKRGDRTMPLRATIDPAEIPSLLPHMMLVDTAPTLESFRYRLFGTSVCQGFGHDRTGVLFGDLPKIDNFDAVYEGYWSTYKTGEPHYFPGRIVSETKDSISYSRLTLPLTDEGDTVDVILGGVVFFQTGKRGSWL